MNKQRFSILLRYPLVAAALVWSQVPGTMPQALAQTPTVDPTDPAPVQRLIQKTTLSQRQAAAAAYAEARAAAAAKQKSMAAKPVAMSAQGVPIAAATLPPGQIAPPGVMNPRGTPDYLGGVIPNWARSPIIRKFVDTLPGLGPNNANNLGNYIPIATKNTTLYPGSDYYNIGLVDYTQRLHTDLPATKLRGYKDLAGGDGKAHYLGPVIIAQRDRPVRVKFQNQLGTGAAGNLFLPVDTTNMGAGMGPGGVPYSENRATLHLHGGLSPWISDGTAHQWITPAGDPTPFKKGASFADVPDMPATAPGDGVQNLFWTNQQSSRLMFYHDHSYGITKLNVYAGEAAGYLITEPKEEELINTGVIPGATMPAEYRYGIPLIIQDKSFVPGPTDLAFQDPTWDTAAWGGYGQLWWPHVYMPNQNPADPTGANPMGRWDYGPWFWPPLPVADRVNNEPLSIPIANGPQSLGPGLASYPGTPNPSFTPEAFMDTLLVNGQAYPTVTLQPTTYRFRMLNGSDDRWYSFSFYKADATGTEVTMVPATPAEAALAAAAGHPNWPSDGRPEGVVDWRSAGPDIIQIGTESGFLASPVVIPPQPTTYVMDRRNIVVLNVDKKSVFLGPAERADIIVDFSGFAGQTLILYNDMLSPVPAFDPRYDYFTNNPDLTAVGGAPTTLPGFGPNTRTAMQVKIANTAPSAPFNLANLNAAFAGTNTTKSVFAETQHPPIVPQTFYNSAMNKTYPVDTYSTIQANTLTFNKTENNVPVTMDLKPKAIHELWEMEYGRMNAILAAELPFTNNANQTTIPLAFTDPTTEILEDGTTQLWKITHNGVDTHPVHFHFMDVQIVNRVGWDGAVRFPDPNEQGWKETVKMNPLEDIIVAMRPISPKLPFTVPNSVRPLDVTLLPTQTHWVTDMTNVLPGAPPPNMTNVLNAPVNFGWEYTWHCHILGHEENDFMRAIQVNVATQVPADPTNLVATIAAPTRIDLTWLDNSLNETGFRVERQIGAGAFTKLADTVPDQNNFSDMTAVAGTTYHYRVFAYNQAGDSLNATNLAGPTTPPATMPPATGLTVTANLASPFTTGAPVVFTAAGSGSGGYEYQFYLYDGTTFSLEQAYGTASTFVLPVSKPAGTYLLRVWVRTNPANPLYDRYADFNFVVNQPPATGVSVTPSVPSPFLPGALVDFTAQGLGASNYQYQFFLYNYSTFTMVQSYSTSPIYPLPTNTPEGSYLLRVWVKTTAAPLYDAYGDYSFQVIQQPATGVSVSASAPSPITFNTQPVFTATGIGSNNYQYAFYLYDGTTFSLVQPYSATATWTLPLAKPRGTYLLRVWVKSIPTAPTYEAYGDFNFVIQ